MQDIATPDRPDLIAARLRRPRSSLASHDVDGNGSVLLISSDEPEDTRQVEPKNQLEAMKDDKIGWTAAENKSWKITRQMGHLSLLTAQTLNARRLGGDWSNLFGCTKDNEMANSRRAYVFKAVLNSRV